MKDLYSSHFIWKRIEKPHTLRKNKQEHFIPRCSWFTPITFYSILHCLKCDFCFMWNGIFSPCEIWVAFAEENQLRQGHSIQPPNLFLTSVDNVFRSRLRLKLWNAYMAEALKHWGPYPGSDLWKYTTPWAWWFIPASCQNVGLCSRGAGVGNPLGFLWRAVGFSSPSLRQVFDLSDVSFTCFCFHWKC